METSFFYTANLNYWNERCAYILKLPGWMSAVLKLQPVWHEITSVCAVCRSGCIGLISAHLILSQPLKVCIAAAGSSVGPTGVIATTMNDSFDTARVLIQDMETGVLDVSTVKPGSQTVTPLLQKRGTAIRFTALQKRRLVQMLG